MDIERVIAAGNRFRVPAIGDPAANSIGAQYGRAAVQPTQCWPPTVARSVVRISRRAPLVGLMAYDCANTAPHLRPAVSQRIHLSEPTRPLGKRVQAPSLSTRCCCIIITGGAHLSIKNLLEYGKQQVRVVMSAVDGNYQQRAAEPNLFHLRCSRDAADSDSTRLCGGTRHRI